jgi:hypothetical protein
MYEGRVMSIGITAKRMVGSCLRIRIMASCWSVVFAKLYLKGSPVETQQLK